ncbi:MAG: type I-U CRISPR-associated protein Cas7 [Pirellulaceae bacterium]|nr:type I-U CRISPR-associated protein Cas7 [Pirellulaceae bacterium]
MAVESVDAEPCVIYPPTYADIGYNVDTLADGTRVALVDSVGSQANRLEPTFIAVGTTRDKWLVPQLDIVLHTEPCGECDNCKKFGEKKKRKADEECLSPHKEKRSILELAHRIADAVVQSSPTLLPIVSKAFQKLRQTGDAGPLCAIAPTSLVFGVWDSRGGTGEKRPRLVRSLVRAWDVDTLHAAAQFNSVWKGLDEEQQEALKKEAKAKKTKLSEKGLADAPAIFRNTKLPQYGRDGTPNPDARVLGGVLVRGRIEREVTVNLVALRGIRGSDDKESVHIRKYLLGLSLIAATADIDLFLREGCHLRYTGEDQWHAIQRRGNPLQIDLGSDAARAVVRQFASDAAAHFRPQWPETVDHAFSLDEAKKLLTKSTEEEIPGEG